MSIAILAISASDLETFSACTACTSQGVKLQGGGPRSAIALRPGTRVVWECSTLIGASPALLSTLPVVHVHTPVQV